MDVPHALLFYVFDVVLYVLRIGDDDGTVVIAVLRILRLLMLVIDTGVEDCLHTVFYKPLDMAVDKLCRIAQGLGRNGFHSLFVDGA